MSTSSITHRPSTFVAAAAAVAAIAAGTVAVSVSRHPSATIAPAEQSQTSARSTAPHVQHFRATTSGGRVVLGE